MDTMELDETQRFTIDPRPRALVLVAEPSVECALIAVLADAGLAAEGLRDPLALMETVDRQWPELIVIGELFPQVSGRQLALSLRARGSTFAVPVVGVLGELSAPAVVRWLTVGAVDAWPAVGGKDLASRAKRLLGECRATQVQTQPVAARLLAFARRASLAGVAIVYPDTPFEGRALFEQGELTEAFFGDLRGPDALAQLLDLDDAPLFWVDTAVEAQPKASASFAGHSSRVLVVEDVQLLGVQLKDTLSAAGYHVEVARDGRAGLKAALAEHFDVVLIDLNLPLLDGWGLMRQLREDPVARESAVLVLSAQEAHVDTLKAARAGARAWLKKTGRAKETLDAVELLVRPRAQAWGQLSARKEATIELRAVGPVWLLRSLIDLDCRGCLMVDDELSHFEVWVSEGRLAAATASVGNRRLHGRSAIQALLGSRGTGLFEPRETPLPAGAPRLDDLVRSACEALIWESQRALERVMSSPEALHMSQDLALLFARFATAREIQVMDAFAFLPRSVEAIACEVGQEPEEVRAALVELLRRGVLSVEPA